MKTLSSACLEKSPKYFLEEPKYETLIKNVKLHIKFQLLTQNTFQDGKYFRL